MESIIQKLKVKPVTAPENSGFNFNIFNRDDNPVVDDKQTQGIQIKNVNVINKLRAFNREDFMKTLYDVHKPVIRDARMETLVEEQDLERKEKTIKARKPKQYNDNDYDNDYNDNDNIGKDNNNNNIVSRPQPKVILFRRLNRSVVIQIPDGEKYEDQLIDETEMEEQDLGEIEKMKRQLPDPRETDDVMYADSYYLNNRKVFIEQMNQLIAPYKSKIKEQEISCSTGKKSDFSLLPHQHIVREYMNVYSPYRGILLYHGLGSGKTCSSIAIAEGLKTDKKVFIMTPASLRMNYIEELKYCGDVFHKKTQYWYFLSFSDHEREVITNLAAHLNVTESVLEKNRGLWVMQKNKPSNYDSLSGKQRLALERQLNDMIKHKYTFIHYNGIRINHLDILSNNRTINPFDNKVIVVDEAHNLVSRIVNQLKKRKTITQEHIDNNISLRLYNYFLTAENCKIVLLSGTPIINYPEEIGILFNILRGYIYTWTMKLRVNVQGKKIDTEYFKDLFRSISTMDYIDFVPSTSTLTVTRNPYGFVNDAENIDRKKLDRDVGNISNTEFQEQLRGLLEQNSFSIEEGSFKVHKNKALPDNSDAFATNFIKNEKFVNDIMLKRRIMGLTSYFRSAQERLMPKFDPNVDIIDVKIEMSNEQFSIYNEARHIERKQEMKKRMKKDGESNSTYRIFSRLFCNFVFPSEFKRPLPKEDYDLEKGLLDVERVSEDVVDNIPLEQRMDNAQGEIDPSEESELRKEINDVRDGNYEKRINEALSFLKENQSKYLSKTGLVTYSPKFLAMINNIENPDHSGLHLVYSQFRTLEGIGIFKMVLEANGFAEFTLKPSGNGWNIDIAVEDLGKPTFVLYTGTETDEYKEIVRNVFNGNWDVIPSNLREELMKSYNTNKNGEVIRIFMITQSGAEGISLKNVKYVHIMEPYWHPVREEQVIGRARRICSHEELPEEDRFVKVFRYMMKLKEEFTSGPEAGELIQHDHSKRDKQKILTTDEALEEISRIKKDYNTSILKAVKESAIDCAFHLTNSDKNDENLQCFSFGTTSADQMAYAPFFEQEERDEMYKKNVTEDIFDVAPVTINGVRYMIRLDENKKPMNEVYDEASYMYKRDRDPNAKLIRVTHIKVTSEGKIKVIKKTKKERKKPKNNEEKQKKREKEKEKDIKDE